MRKKGEEIEVELIPAKSLSSRYAIYLSTTGSNIVTNNPITTINNNSSPAATTSSSNHNNSPFNLLLRRKYVKAPADITSKCFLRIFKL